MLIAVAAFCFAACGNSNANKEAAAETKAAHECTKAAEAQAEHKCANCAKNATAEAQAEHKCEGCKKNAEGANHECNKPADQKCEKCKQAEATKTAEQTK